MAAEEAVGAEEVAVNTTIYKCKFYLSFRFKFWQSNVGTDVPTGCNSRKMKEKM